VTATFTGVHHHDHRLPEWTPDALRSNVDEMRALRASLAATDLPAEPAFPALQDVRQRDRALARAFLDVQIAEHESGHFYQRNPSLAIGEAVFGVVALMTRPFAPMASRVDAAAARLGAIPAFLAGARRTIACGVPDEWRVRALRECDGADRLCASMTKWLQAEPLEASDRTRADRLFEAARHAREAFEDFRHWLAREAASAGPDGYPCGPELFDLLLTRGHWSAQTRADLLADARAHLKEALARLDEQAREVGARGWGEVETRLADVHPSAAEYLGEYQRIWDACRERAEAARLVTWPAWPIHYVPIPVQTRDAAPYLYYLFYRSPAPFDTLPIHDYVVTPIDAGMPPDEQLRRLRATNTSVIKLNHVVHHGAIGHHVQNYHAYQGRSEIGRVAAVDGASRIGMFGGGSMAEGWACYATDLMEEAGFLTPDERVAQQHTRARLLARAVVDIGLHERSLTFDEAVAIYRDQIGMPPEAARAETCKNSMFPGTGLMYWLGTDGLHRLRRARERADGATFSLRGFHDRLLAYGSIPVPLVARLME
jgi:hypothetical protein